MEVLQVVAALAAIAASLWAWSSSRSAAKSYHLALKQEASRKPHIELYLIEGERLVSKTDKSRMYKFHLRATNLAGAPNAVVGILLEIEYSRQAAQGLRLVIHHRPSGDEASFKLPKLLQPKEPVAGWAIFIVPDELRAGARAESYRVVLVDSAGNRFEVRPIIIPEREL